MKIKGNPPKITRRQAMKVTGAAIAGLAVGSVSTSSRSVAAAATEERNALAQKYKNAEPGEKFMIGHITWGLAQEYLMMCHQACEQAWISQVLWLNLMQRGSRQLRV